MSGDKDFSTFFLAFVGQKVTITSDISATTMVGTGPEGFPIMETVPLFYEGVLLDFDDEYYYLGPENDPNQITQAVKKSTVRHLIVIDDKDIYDAILNQMPEPEGEGIN